MPLGKLALESMLEIAFDRRRSNALSPAPAAAVDSIQVQFIDGLLKGFVGPLKRQHSRMAIAVLAPASLAQPLPQFGFQKLRPAGPSTHGVPSAGATPCSAARPHRNADTPSAPYIAPGSAHLYGSSLSR